MYGMAKVGVQGWRVRAAPWSSLWSSWPGGSARRSRPKEQWGSRSSASWPEDECAARGRCRASRRIRPPTPRRSCPRRSPSVAGTDGAQIAVDMGGLHRVFIGEPRARGGQRRRLLGLFQQRAAAGGGHRARKRTRRRHRHVRRAALGCPVRQSIAPWVAAQDVQDSAFEGVPSASNGGSSVVGAQLQGELDPGRHLLGRHRRLVRAHGLRRRERRRAGRPGEFVRVARGYAIPSNATLAETLAITYAISKLGNAYVWGAAGPASFDCSGPYHDGLGPSRRGARGLHGGPDARGHAVDGLAATSPGDLVLIPGSDGTLANPGHVGLYIGEGLVLSATDPVQGVVVQTWASFTAGGLSGIRYLG